MLSKITLIMKLLSNIAYWVKNCCIAFAVGIVASLLIYLFHHVMYFIMYLYSGVNSTHLVYVASHLSPEMRIIIPALGAFIAGVIMFIYQKKHKNKAKHATDYHAINDEQSVKLDLVPSLIKCIAILAVVSAGNSIGKEGAMILLSALGASLIAQYFSTSKQYYCWVNCGTAAGMSCAYFTPIASCFYVLEIIIKYRQFKMIPMLLISAFTATYLSHYLHHSSGHLYTINDVNWPSMMSYILLVVIALCMGVVAPLFFKGIYYFRRAFKLIPLPLPLLFLLGGLLVGVLSVITPNVWGNGYSSVLLLLSTPSLPLIAAMIILVAKLLAIFFINGSGAPGGTFTPILFLGASLGFILLHSLSIAFSLPLSDSTFLTLMGMAALLSAGIKAPLTASFTVMEMSGQYHLLPFFIVCCLIAYFVTLQVNKKIRY